MEYFTLCLKSTEYDFLRELSNLIQIPENAYGIECITNLPDATFVFIRQEHTHFGLLVKEIQGRCAVPIPHLNMDCVVVSLLVVTALIVVVAG